MKTPRQIIVERARLFAEENLKKISVTMGRYDGSQRCQHISRQLVEEGGADSVVVALSFVPNSGVNIHFINRVGDEYVDNTLGYLGKENTYYNISEHTLSELQGVRMNKMLVEEKEKMLSKLFTAEERKSLAVSLEDI